MPSIDDVYAGDTLRSEDIAGREPTVTIAAIEPREFKSNDGKAQKKLVISFRGAQKKFICNLTNAKRIAYLHGKDYNGWIGKQITLFVDPFVQFGNEIKPAIRVKPPELKPNPNVTSGPALQDAPMNSRPIEKPAEASADDFGDEIPF